MSDERPTPPSYEPLPEDWATALFVLFAATFVFPSTEARWIVSACYAALAVGLFALRARPLARTVTAPFRRLRE